MDPRTESMTYPASPNVPHPLHYPEETIDSPSRMLDRMERHAEFLVHLGHRLSNVIDRIHGPTPEQITKEAGCEPPSTMMWQTDKMEIQARRLSNMIEALEHSI